MLNDKGFFAEISCVAIRAWFKKGSGTVVRSTLRAVPATVPDPFLNQAAIRSRLAQLEIEGLAGEIDD